MADYQPLLTRAIANLANAGTLVARHAIYERARKAQQAQLSTQHPPLRECDLALEKEALEQAIAFVEAKFGRTEYTPAKPPFAATNPAEATRQASDGSAPPDAAGTEASIPTAYKRIKIVPPNARAEKLRLWHAPAAALATVLAVVLGAVLAMTGAAIVMRYTPPDLAGPPSEALLEPAPQQPTRIAQRAQLPVTEGSSTAPPASVAPRNQPTGQSGAEPASQAPDATSPAPPDKAQAAMLIASDNPMRPMVSFGSTVWSTIRPVPRNPATVAVKADASIPDLKMHATMTLRKNTDPTLQATYTIDLKFSFSDGVPIIGVEDVEPKMRDLGSTASEALTSVKIEISDTYFLIALVNSDPDSARNLDLMQKRAWFDFSLRLKDKRIAKLLFQKSLNGEAMLANAFKAWK
jgi:hypothetical protein